MRFGVAIAPERPDETVELARRAEQLGLDWFGVADSPLYGDCFSHLCLAGAATTEIHLGSVVTSPVGRHPALLAAGARTVSAVAPGRVRLAIGSGNSAARGLGVSPASFDEVVAAAELVRASVERGDVRVLVAADGPRGARAACGSGDGWLLGAGFDQAARHELLEQVDGLPRRAGWDWWLSGTSSLAHAPDEVMEDVGELVVAMGNRALRADRRPGRFPAHLHEAVEAMNRGYDYAAHAVLGSTRNTRLLTPALRDFLLDRLCLWGDADRWARSISEMQADGVVGVILFLGAADRRAELERLGERIAVLA
ncbi:MAG: LLM class flavin-dependent oxidoreductase [Acidimicrobiia bacterium]